MAKRTKESPDSPQATVDDMIAALDEANNTIDDLNGQIKALSEGEGSSALAERINKATLVGKHDGYFVVKESEMNALLAAMVLRRPEAFMGVSLISWAMRAFSLDTYQEAQDLIQAAKNTHMGG